MTMEIIENIVHSSEWMTITEKGTINDFENSAKEVEIDINGIIGGSFWDEDSEENINTKEKMKAELKYLAGLKAKKIIVNIDSLGGSFAHAISIHDLLAESKAHVTTKLNGMSASAATIISQSGNERQMSENALILIHKSMLGIMDYLNEDKIKGYLKSLETIDKKIVDIYTNRSGVEREKIQSLLSENNGQGIWIDSKEAKEYGLIDNEFKPMKVAAMANIEILNKYKLPIPKQMEKELENKSLLEQLKNFVSDTFFNKKVENEQEKEPEIVEPVINQEIDTITPEVEPEKEVIEEKQEPVNQDNDILKAELETLRARNSQLEADLLKNMADSTKVASKKGMEDVSDISQNEQDQQVIEDLKKLRAEMTVIKY